MTPLELNAAIDTLIESHGSDESARRAVWSYAKTLTPASAVMCSLSMDAGSKSDGFSGHTAHGNIRVTDDKEESKQIGFTIGSDSINRVGYYRIQLFTFDKPKHARLRITHFWKATEETASDTERPEEWILRGSLEEQDASYFGRVGERVYNFFIGQWVQYIAVREWSDSPHAKPTEHINRKLVFH